MDEASLRRLAADGIAALPPSQLGTLVEWCWDYSEATGDARWSSVARALTPLTNAFEDAGHVLSSAAACVDDVLARGLPAILDAHSAEHGAHLARALREALADCYGTPQSN